MAYEIRAAVGLASLLKDVSGVLGEPVVALHGTFGLVPVTDAATATLGVSNTDLEIAGLVGCHSVVAQVLAGASISGPVAFVEAEFFGGVGEQGAAVWNAGSLSWAAPTAEARWSSSERTPISEALYRVGVEASPGADEFETVGLGRHRSTSDWA